MKRKYWLPLAVGAVFFGAGIAFVFTRPLIDSDAAAFRLMTTHSNLSIIGDSIVYWTMKHGRAPNDKENFSVLKMTTNSPIDGWEKPLKYRNMEIAGPGRFLLYSTGPDGIDENGSGDDVVYRRNVSAAEKRE